MMSHLHGRALTDKQNVLHVFSKHLKSTDKTCSPTNRFTPHCCSSSHTKNTEAQNSQTNKTKRLKTRKERSQVNRGGSKCRSHHHNQHQSGKEKDHCHGCCQSSSRPPPRRDAPFARVFPAGQEHSIITINRLIGHHGLFNHEVKSIDIERLLSEQKKLEKFGQHGGRGKTTATLPPLPPSSSLPFSSPVPDSDVAEVAVSNNDEEAPDKGRVERVVAKSSTTVHKRDECKSNSESRLFKCSHRDTQEDLRRKFTSIQVCQEENVASHSNSQESGITPEQRQTHHSGLTSSEGDVVTLSSTESPSSVVRTKSKWPRPVVCETVMSPSGKNENERPPYTRAKVKPTVLTLEQTPKNHEPILPHTQPFRPSPNITVSSFPARGGSSESSDNQTQQTVPNPVSVVAARLCRSLQLPLLRRRHLVAESREVLLQALQERHGPQLQENLLSVQRRLCFGTGPTTTRAGQGQSTILAGVDADGGCPAAPLDDGFGESMVEQPCLDSQRSAPNKRRRKQLCPNRVTPPQPLSGPQHSLDTAAAWNPNPSVEQVGELIGELLRPPSSSHFLMNLQPSGSPSCHHIFSPPPASPWAAQSGLLQPWDDGSDRGSTRESTRVDHFENWRYDPDFSYLNQTDTVRERSRGPFYHEKSRPQYPTGPLEGHRDRHLPQQQDPYNIERRHFGGASSSFSAPTHYPLDSHQLHPFYHFNRPPASPGIPRSHLPDMAYYPPSHMLESSLSPPLPPGSLPAFPSPERWSFPRMRLY
ncbi:uncharacterized protein LOC121542869 [Coregonus clupeaformis]|uniref:uncharacterized protein LOC121542869 n=1 Tax=Coregonus clupeaformis TaxID=59861 RepID=UPI001E1C2EDF|nr:uncharacterized protein LOC121542869 [Coregonus clupeaformis]